MTVDAPTATAGHDPIIDAMLPRPFQVVATRLDTRDTVTLALEPGSMLSENKIAAEITTVSTGSRKFSA